MNTLSRIDRFVPLMDESDVIGYRGLAARDVTLLHISRNKNVVGLRGRLSLVVTARSSDNIGMLGTLENEFTPVICNLTREGKFNFHRAYVTS